MRFYSFVFPLLLGVCVLCAAPAFSLTLYVAPGGNDAWTGQLAAANADQSDGPLATLEGAREAVLKSKGRRGFPPGGVEVVIQPGTYVRTTTFTLGDDLKGAVYAPIRFRSGEGGQARFIGGVLVPALAPVTDEAVRARFQEAARANILQTDLKALGITEFGTLKPRGFGRGGQTMALELFFDGNPMTLSRWPNDDWAKVAGAPEGPEGGKFTYEGDRPSGWAPNDDLWVHGYWTWDWADSFTKVASIDTAARLITTTEPHGVYGYKEGARFYFLNVLEELDAPGEYYVDRASGILYFWPPAPVEGKEIAVSMMEEPMVKAENTAHLSFEGLRFEYTRGPGLYLNGGAHNVIKDCTFANLGTDAMSIGGGEDNGADGCLLYNLGYGGISIGGGDRNTLTPAGNYATNNEVHDFSRAVRTYTPAVSVGGVGNLIAHNLLYNAPHMAIGLGGNDHRIEYNEIHHVCMETHDAGAFYMGRDWTQRGNIVRYNFMHELGHGDVQAVYLDDWTSGTLVYGNILQGARRGVLNGGGRDNIVENNIFIDCGAAVHIDERGKGWAKGYFDGTTTTLFDRLKDVKGTEPPYTEHYPPLATLLEDDPVSAKGNVVSRNISVNSTFLELYDGLTADTPYLKIENNLVDVDPLFVDAANKNYALRDESPAYTQINFQPIPMDKIGPQRSAGIPAHDSRSTGILAHDSGQDLVAGEFKIRNLVSPLISGDDPRSWHKYPVTAFPMADAPVVEHVRVGFDLPVDTEPAALGSHGGNVMLITKQGECVPLFPEDMQVDSWGPLTEQADFYPRAQNYPHSVRYDFQTSGWQHSTKAPDVRKEDFTSFLYFDNVAWSGTLNGLYVNDQFYNHYGIQGPLSSQINALAKDSKHNLWVGTPLGLSVRDPDGKWRHIRGKEGLPYEDITALAFDSKDRLWIGTSKGAIHYRPYAEGRQWFYRQGLRYLPSDNVIDVAVTPDGSKAFFLTDVGLSVLEERPTTLLEKANTIEKLVNERHRRFGLVADCALDNALNPTSHTIGDNDNDGLWTAYHVAAMSLAYAVTGDPEQLASAKESMDAVILLQNASGTPGLVARSVLPLEEGKDKGPQWRLTPDGTMYWKSDTSSDEIDGHYLALYAYWEHIARYRIEERERIIKQTRDLTNYLVDNNYQLIDWDGERTRWGFWNPESLNEEPQHYLENGLNSLQMLSFLKVAFHITGDAKFKEHFDKLILEHDYLNNVLLEKKVFPDENNHSDNQLGFVAWYPWLQLEKDPRVRELMLQSVRRHYKTLARDKSSFFYLTAATIDPDYVNIEDAILNLREIPTDRRQWRQENSHRADVIFDPRVDRFGSKQLLTVLPADECCFNKWNSNPYIPDEGGDGRTESEGAHYLLPYWMARYHGFLNAPLN